MTTSTDLLYLLDAPGPLAIDCGARPRLPAPFLFAAANRQAPVRMTAVGVDLGWALHLLGLSGRFSVPSSGVLQPRDLPFQVSLEVDGTLLVTVDRTIANSKNLAEPGAHTWVRGLDAPRIIVDFAAVELVNSVLIAWLLQLAHAAKPAQMVVRHARTQIATQFKQLRLDQIMTIL